MMDLIVSQPNGLLVGQRLQLYLSAAGVHGQSTWYLNAPSMSAATGPEGGACQF